MLWSSGAVVLWCCIGAVMVVSCNTSWVCSFVLALPIEGGPVVDNLRMIVFSMLEVWRVAVTGFPVNDLPRGNTLLRCYSTLYRTPICLSYTNVAF